MTKKMSHRLFLVFLLALGLLSGCTTKMIPNTSVPQSKENRKIINFMEKYKDAFQSRSTDAVMDLVATDYHDYAGNENPQNRIDYLSLKEKLDNFFPRVLDMRVGVFVQNVERNEQGLYEVVFYYKSESLVEMPNGNEWITSNDVNKFILRKVTPKYHDDKEFEIVSGI